jgi:peptide deformylase
MMNIIHYPHPILTEIAEDIFNIDAHMDTLNKMKQYVENPENKALGLAMPQIGISKRGFVAWIKGEARIIINPRILSPKGTVRGTEACLSLPNQKGAVARYKRLKAVFTDETGKRRALDLKGLDAVVFQHELDHLDGILISSKFVEENKKVI